MSTEDRIRAAARKLVRVKITGRSRSAKGFLVEVASFAPMVQTRETFPNKRTALANLLAKVRCTAAVHFTLKPKK